MRKYPGNLVVDRARDDDNAVVDLATAVRGRHCRRAAGASTSRRVALIGGRARCLGPATIHARMAPGCPVNRRGAAGPTGSSAPCPGAGHPPWRHGTSRRAAQNPCRRRLHPSGEPICLPPLPPPTPVGAPAALRWLPGSVVLCAGGPKLLAGAPPLPARALHCPRPKPAIAQVSLYGAAFVHTSRTWNRSSAVGLAPVWQRRTLGSNLRVPLGRHGGHTGMRPIGPAEEIFVRAGAGVELQHVLGPLLARPAPCIVALVAPMSVDPVDLVREVVG